MTPRVLSCFKEIIRRIRRLPVDYRTLNILSTYAKKEFKVPLKKRNFKFVPMNLKLYDRAVQIMDNILERRDPDVIHNILDFSYKEVEPAPTWVRLFQKQKFLLFKQYWPQVHLIDEIAPGSKLQKAYWQKLKEETGPEFSLMNFFGIDEKNVEGELEPIKKDKGSTNSLISELADRYFALHTFLFHNQAKITHLKIQAMEVFYPPNVFGLPLHTQRRNEIFLDKINYSKRVSLEYRAIEKETLRYLIDFAIHTPGEKEAIEPYRINRNYHRYMQRKLKGDYKKSLRKPKKQLILNDNNIRKIYRAYVSKQFYYDKDSQKYKLSWMQNFYENDKRIAPDITLPCN